MTDGHYRDSLEAARTEMDALLTEQGVIEQRLSFIEGRIDVLRKTILSLSELTGEAKEPQTVGITAAIRKVLRECKAADGDQAYISPTGVRNMLQRNSFPLSEYK